MIRESESRYVARCIQSARSCSVIGLSNMGKSSLLRELCSPAVRSELLQNRIDDYLFVYVDCNRMVRCTEQALHEATLRSIINTLRHAGAQDQLLQTLRSLHAEIVEPGSPIRSPLAFDGAVRMVCEESKRMLVLLFDEFDESFEKLDGHTFLNLRAMKDEHAGALTFVTATERPLHQIRSDNDGNEFSELFSTRELWLGFSSRADAMEIAATAAATATWVRQITVCVEDQDLNFIVSVAGGHAGLIRGVTEAWMRMASGMQDDVRQTAQDLARKALDSDRTVRSECMRIWNQLTCTQQNALAASFDEDDEDDEDDATPEALEQLHTMRIAADGRGDVLVGSAWRSFVCDQAHNRPDQPGVARPGVHVDGEAGIAYVDGEAVQLTNLEFKLLKFFYEQANKVVDRQTIIKEVWREEYQGKMDDARIEKIVSQLRPKLKQRERDLKTLHGRGYSLTVAQSTPKMLPYIDLDRPQRQSTSDPDTPLYERQSTSDPDTPLYVRPAKIEERQSTSNHDLWVVAAALFAAGTFCLLLTLGISEIRSLFY